MREVNKIEIVIVKCLTIGCKGRQTARRFFKCHAPQKSLAVYPGLLPGMFAAPEP